VINQDLSSVKRNYATYENLLDYLLELSCKKDPRLGDTIVVQTIDGDTYPAEFLEFAGDEIREDGQICLLAKDWNEHDAS
jgi:hypothetical protein